MNGIDDGLVTKLRANAGIPIVAHRQAHGANGVLSSAARELRERRVELHERVVEMDKRRAALFAKTDTLHAHFEAMKKTLESIRQRAGERGSADVPTPNSRFIADDERARLAKRFETLSPRQREVLKAVIMGKANKAIAFDLGVSQKTVETHRARVMDKLRVSSLAELVRLSLLAGIT